MEGQGQGQRGDSFYGLSVPPANQESRGPRVCGAVAWAVLKMGWSGVSAV